MKKLLDKVINVLGFIFFLIVMIILFIPVVLIHGLIAYKRFMWYQIDLANDRKPKEYHIYY